MATSDGARKLDATSSLHIAIHNAYARELAASLRGDDDDGKTKAKECENDPRQAESDLNSTFP